MLSWILKFFKKEQKQKPSQTTAPAIAVKTTIESRTVTADRYFAGSDKISRLNLGGYISPSGGYLNWAIFKVAGKNQTTGRRKTMQIEAKNEAAAIQCAEANGIIAPHEITAIPHELPTENQIQYLQSFKATVPEDATKLDVSAIIDRFEKLNIEAAPSEEFAKFADDIGVKFSRYIGKDTLFGGTISHLDGTDRIEFYAYCILCSQQNTEVGDLRKSAYYNQIKDFARIAISNDTVVRSIFGRTPNDYLHPHKGTAAYKAVAEFFKI